MKKKNKTGYNFLIGLTMVFLYAPIFVLMFFSFNQSSSRTVFTGFTLDWYIELFNDKMIMESIYTTLLLSLLAAAIATVAGTFAAVGFFNMRRGPRSALLTINNIPVVNADIITGVSMSLLFILGLGLLNNFFGLFGANVNLQLGFGTLLIAHITFNIPYVILSVMPKLYQLDKNMFEAAQDLGCTWMRAFFKVIIPQIRPGIVNGMIIAFTMSIDDFVISYFTAGSGAQTLSMVIYSMTKKRVTPTINALSTIMFLTVILLLVIINVREIRQQKAAEKRNQILKGVEN